MTNTISSAGNGPTTSSARPRLCRSDHQPNMLEYIDTTLNDSFSSRLRIQTSNTVTTNNVNGFDQFGNTIVDQYLLYILCQKIHPNRTDHRADQLYQSLHRLLISHGQISKSFFEYSSSSVVNRSNYAALFHHYTNFIWNEFDVKILLELGCFLLKYRLHDIFTSSPRQSQKILGYFLEILVIYYLSSFHEDYFLHSRSTDMLFPYPSSFSSLTENSSTIFEKFLRQIFENGEILYDLRQMKILLQSDAYQFVQKKLENKKIGFVNFLDSQRRFFPCRTLKSRCRVTIKMHLKEFPQDIKQLSLYPSITDRLLTYLTYENKNAFESDV